MDILYKDVGDIIYKFKHQMELADVMKEFKYSKWNIDKMWSIDIMTLDREADYKKVIRNEVIESRGFIYEDSKWRTDDPLWDKYVDPCILKEKAYFKILLS